MTRSTLGLAALLAACTSSADVLAKLPPVSPLPPATAEDSIVRLALSLTFRELTPRFPALPTVIRTDGSSVSPRSLPALDDARYLLLPDSTVRRIARRPGAFQVVRVTVKRAGDSAAVSVWQGWAGDRDLIAHRRGDEGGCTWVLKRDRNGWGVKHPAPYACHLLWLFGPCFVENPSGSVWPRLDWPYQN